jgi:Dolichyl-phosphate-mannose-protein mannosyltransferase
VVDALAMAVGLALLAAIAVTGPAALGIRGRAARAPAGLILCAATVVGASVVLSLMRELTRGGMLLSQLLVAGVSVGVWVRVRRPVRPTVRWPRRRELVRTVHAHPLTIVLAALVLASLGLEFVLAVTVAPNNWDSMGYHLSRAAYWLQYESVLQFPGGSIRQLYYPPNGEILQTWTLAVSGTDRFAQLVQWVSGIGCGLCVYLGARLLGFRRAHAIFAAGLFMVLPIVVLESTTTQNDLITAFFIASSGVFAVRGVAARSYGDLVVAALALGLAVGTKGTALVALPSLLILVGAAAWWHRPPLKLALGGVVIAVLAVIALGSFNYVQSWEKTGSPFGKASHLTDRTDGLVPNATRGAWTFVDLPGMQVEWLDTAVQRPARALFGDLEKENYEFTGTPTRSVDRECRRTSRPLDRWDGSSYYRWSCSR